MAHLETRRDQRVLERVRTADEKRDEIRAPEIDDLVPLFEQDAFAVDAVLRQIRAQVGARRDRRFVSPRRERFDERTRNGVASAEVGHLFGAIAWNDRKIGLNVLGSETVRRADMGSRANRGANLARILPRNGVGRHGFEGTSGTGVLRGCGIPLSVGRGVGVGCGVGLLL